jgi:hypothetical protein
MVVGAAALAVALPAAATAAPPTTAQLQQQVKALQGQVKVLQAQMKAQQARERFDRSEIAANYSGDACLAASVTDLFQGTWALIDQGATAPRFKKEPPVDDTGVCKSMGITRPGGALPPSIAALGALVVWMLGG